MSIQGSAGAWGRDPITQAQAEGFASRLSLPSEESRKVAQTLADFPTACEVRGMFFEGLSNAIANQVGERASKEIAEFAGVANSIIAFTLHPHRDFYKLFFAAAIRLHPGVPLEKAMSRVAASFYPVFRQSTLGKTMSIFMGKEPAKMLGRLADAYSISVPWNEHSCFAAGSKEVQWRCFVEPSVFYPAILSGIVAGTMQSHGAPEPTVRVVEQQRDGEGQRMLFAIRW